MNPDREVWLLRHAETEWSLNGRHTGLTDLPLTDAGRERGRQLAQVVSVRNFDRVLSSPLERARETCRLAGLEAQMALHDGLLEWDYGDYEGLTTAEIRVDRPGWYLWSDGCPGGESPEQVEARVDELLGHTLDADGPVALFAHGHILRALTARWLELPVAAGGRLALSAGAVCVLGYEREVRVLWRWNDTSS
jgi:probable phosphoglycerate mutase